MSFCIAFLVAKVDMIYLKSTGSMPLNSPNESGKIVKASIFLFFEFPISFFCTCLFMHMNDMSRRFAYCNFICAHIFCQILSIHFMCMYTMLFTCFFSFLYCFFFEFTSQRTNEMNKLIKTKTTFQEFYLLT